MRTERLGRRAACGPALDSEHRDVASERPPQRVAEPADRRVVLEHEDALRERLEPRGVEAVEPRHVHDLELDAALAEQLRREQRLVEHDRAVREEYGVRAPAERPRRSRSSSGPSSSIRLGDGPIASRIATLSSAATAQRSRSRVSSGLPGCTIVSSGSAASSEMSRTD